MNIIIKKGQEVIKEVIYQEKITFGRHTNNRIQLKGFMISKHHAQLTKNGTSFELEDLNSMTGTYVNGERVMKTIIRDQDIIRINDYELHVNFPEEQIHKQSKEKFNLADQDIPVLKTPANTQSLTVFQGHKNPSGLFDAARKRVHQAVLQAFDLRRISIDADMSDDLKNKTKTIIQESIELQAEAFDKAIDLDKLSKAVYYDICGLGPLEILLQDDSVSEIMVNSPKEIFIEKNGRILNSGLTFANDAAVLAVIDRIISPIGRRIDESSPMVDARLKDGSRVNAIIPPLAIKGPCITIRKFPKHKLNINDLIDFNSMSSAMAHFLSSAVKHGQNIIVSGGTGTGKTTLLNVLSNIIPNHERVITIEDAAELQLNQPDLVALEAKPANAEGKGAVEIRDLVKNALRMRPNRIVVGECRGKEALDMLQAMNTGHEGSLTTLHANTPRDALSRLEVMSLMAGIDLPITSIREQISSAIQLVVQQSRFPCGARKVTYISEIVGMEAGIIQLQDLFRFKSTGRDENGKVKGHFIATGNLPQFYEALVANGEAVDKTLFNQGHIA